MQSHVVPGLYMLEERSQRELRVEKPLILIVVRGVLRVGIGEKHMELGPCTMLYLPPGSRASLSAAWGDVQLYTLESFELGEEPRILYNGYGVKSIDGRAALCIRVDEKGVRVLTPARIYPTSEVKIMIEENGEKKSIKEGSEVAPPAKIVAERRTSALLILGDA